MPQSPLSDPPGAGRKVAALAKVIPASVFLFPSLIAFNGAQMASLAVRPFSRKAFHAFARWGADTWWGWCVTLAQRLHGTHIIVSGDDVPPGESALVVANHQQMADITFLMMYARSKRRLGEMRWFVKDRLKWIPGVGWGLYLLGSVFVRRNWADDRAGIERTFARIRRDRIPIWLLLFAEGTRITPAKLGKSRKVARERGLAEPENVLLPRPRGFVGSVIGLRDHLDAVYDVTLGYADGVPTLWQFMQGFVTRAHLHVRRYPMASLPESEDDLSRWIFDRFHEKDELLANFYATGRFA